MVGMEERHAEPERRRLGSKEMEGAGLVSPMCAWTRDAAFAYAKGTLCTPLGAEHAGFPAEAMSQSWNGGIVRLKGLSILVLAGYMTCSAAQDSLRRTSSARRS